MTEFDRQVQLLSEQQDMLELKKGGMKSEKDLTEDTRRQMATGRSSDRKARTHMLIQIGSAILKETGRTELTSSEIASLAEAVRQICSSSDPSQTELERQARFGKAAEDIYKRSTGHGFTDDQLGAFSSFMEFQEKGGYLSRALDGSRSRKKNTASGSD